MSLLLPAPHPLQARDPNTNPFSRHNPSTVSMKSKQLHQILSTSLARQKSYDAFANRYQRCHLKKIKSLESFQNPKVLPNERKHIGLLLKKVKREISKIKSQQNNGYEADITVNKWREGERTKIQTTAQPNFNKQQQFRAATESEPYLLDQVIYLRKIWQRKHNRPFQFTNFTIPQQANYLRQDLLN